MKFPKLSLGKWPTKLEHHRLHKNFYVKRDDQSQYGRAGIKTRKLETTLSHIIREKYTDVITVVPSVSNLRSDLTLFAGSSDVNFHLILANYPVTTVKSCKFIDRKNLRHVYCGRSKILIFFRLMAMYLTLVLKRRKTLIILPSFAHPTSVMGAANGVIEVLMQCKQMNIPVPNHFFITGCTGASAAGLILASQILKQNNIIDIHIHVVKVFPIQLKLFICLLLHWTKYKYGLNVRIECSRITVYSRRDAVDYGRYSFSIGKICESMKERCNFDLDPIYGAKTWLEMEDFMRRNSNERVLFWHCGYTQDWKDIK